MSLTHCTLRAGSLALSVLFAACATAPHATKTSSASSPVAASERIGVFAPLDPSTIAIWPETWHGELLLLEVAPHGKLVEQGEVLARFYTHAFDEELWQAELEAESATIRHAALLERDRLDELAGHSQLERAKSESERADRALEGWKRFELDFAHRTDDVQRQYSANGIEDQEDELKQLQKMYEADELVDATEEIVLKRSRRSLALSQVSHKLGEEQRKYRDDFERAKESQLHEEAAHTQREAYERLMKTQAIDARVRADAEHRSELALAAQKEKLEKLRGDGTLLTVRAPRKGVLLHGDPREYRPGHGPHELQRGQSVGLRTPLLCVADPEPLSVCFELPEAGLAKMKEGQSVKVSPLFDAAQSGTGKLALEAFPRADNPSDEALHAAHVQLEHAIPGARYGMRAKVTTGS